jgi:hypothetical protein
MEMMVHRCPSCQASLKFGKDKAGRRTKCPKCGGDVTLPRTEDAKAMNSDEDDAGGYGLALFDDEAEREKRELAHAKKAEKKLAERIKVRRKNIGDLDAWRRVYYGLLFILIGACVWGAWIGLHALVLFLGMVQGPEYGPNAERHLMMDVQPAPQPGVAPALNRPMFMLSLLSGTDNVETARVLLIVGQIFVMLQAILWMVGYGMCLSVENRFGTRGQLVFLFSLGGTNLLFNLFLRFLPLCGVVSYVLVPFFAPEIVMSEVNIERIVPLHVHWSSLPTLEIILALIVYLSMMLEPILIGIFIITIAQMIRDQPVEDKASGLVTMGFGVLFIMLCYQMYAVAGSSTVLVRFLRILYILWWGFQIGFVVRLATTCYSARELLKFYLYPHD